MDGYNVFVGIFVLLLLFGGLAARFIQLQREQPPPEQRLVDEDEDEIDQAISRWDHIQTKRSRNIWWD